PRSVAVVGVSENPDNLGRNIVNNLVEFGFQGDIFPVGPKGGRFLHLDIFRRLEDLPQAPDLVVVLAPARVVPSILDACGQMGVMRVVVESGGFSELGTEGQRLEAEVRQLLRKYGIRMMGPNGLGAINLEIGLCVPFMNLPHRPRLGGLSLLCQSGGVGTNVIAWLAQAGLGMNKFVSLGNKLDVNENDLLEFLLDDPGTSLIYLYMEDLTDGRRLMELGRRASKPILLHKANIGELSADIARSHTASLAVDDEVVSAACCQSGILRVHSRNEFLQAAIALQQPPLKGDRLVVLSRSGGEAVVTADACHKAGFKLPPLSPEIVQLIESRSRAGVIKPINPLDLGDIFDFSLYADVAAAFCQDPEVDGIVLNYGPINDLEREAARAMARNLIDTARQHEKPLLITVIGNLEEREYFRQELGVPVFAFPGEAIRALALARNYYTCQLPTAPAAPPEVSSLPAVRQLLAPHLGQPGPLPMPVALEAMATLGIPVPGRRLVASAEEATAAAQALGLPVCLKLVAPSALHKSDLGGVLLNLTSDEAVQRGFAALTQVARTNLPAGEPWQVLVMSFIEKGMEVIIGAKRDRVFGPMLLFGAGGIWVEVLEDVAMRLAPLDLAAALELINDTKIAKILRGFRGQGPSDLRALAQCLVLLSAFMLEFPQVQEVDLNPVRVFPEGQGCLPLDARVI
ncbi:MAG: acetate--CoA ligase family protein, partial [Desulfobacca sp.]|uniref:acetate--CoA ligase family protein n=1 Tax=Desulfobacca sp. TaxID=2067990 RepID=UPI00404AC219